MIVARSARIALPILFLTLLLLMLPVFSSRQPRVSRFANQLPPSAPANVGNGGTNDQILGTGGIIKQAIGRFPTVIGLTSETDSQLSGDTYSIQLNTNMFFCNTAFTDNTLAKCWEQFIFHFDPNSCPFGNCDGNLYIEFWLLGYLTPGTAPGTGHSSCPTADIPNAGVLTTDDWNPAGTNNQSCKADTDTADTDYIPIQSLASLDLVGSAGPNGECVDFDNNSGNGPWQQCDGGNILDLNQNWSFAEFNVFGFANLSRAIFNPGTSITVELDAIQQGTNPPPIGCNLGGFTGETNNLNLVGSCTTGPGQESNSQAITFTESSFDFSITSAQSDVTLLNGESPSCLGASPMCYAITLAGLPVSGGLAGIVTLTVTTNIPGATFVFDNPTGAPDNQPVVGSGPGGFALRFLLVYTNRATGPLGDFQLNIQGAAGPNLTHSIAVNLHIFDFSVVAVPTSQSILTTGSNTYVIAVSLLPGSSSFALPSIALLATNLPSNTTASFSPIIGTPGFFSTLTITTSNAPSGNYTIVLTGTDNRTLQGGTRIATPSLAVLTPALGLPLVMSTVIDLRSSGVLSAGQANSLIMKINQAVDDLTAKTLANPAACNVLGAFVNQVESYVTEGVVTQAQANMLLNRPLGTYAIIAAIPC